MSRDNVRYLSWEDIEDAVYNVALKIQKSRFRPDVIIGVARGGLVPARLLADYLDVVSIGFIGVKFYTSVGEKQEKPVITHPLTLSVNNLKVLLVDDIADTGKSLSLVSNILDMHGARVIRSATLYVKPWSILMPDYYHEVVSEWIVFPWEKAEFLREKKYSVKLPDNEALRALYDRLSRIFKP